MEIRYVGPFDLVEIADAGVEVAKGDTVTVDDDLAVRLCEQPDNWQPVKPAKTPKTADPAATEEL
jgi:hypothetical protein